MEPGGGFLKKNSLESVGREGWSLPAGGPFMLIVRSFPGSFLTKVCAFRFPTFPLFGKALLGSGQRSSGRSRLISLERVPLQKRCAKNWFSTNCRLLQLMLNHPISLNSRWPDSEADPLGCLGTEQRLFPLTAALSKKATFI